MVKRVHHINFLVKNLEQAVDRYQQLLGVTITERDELPDRGVRIARVLAGETWIVLVQPTGSTGVPAEHLAQHGEGFFLISYQVDDIAAAAAKIAATDIAPVNTGVRQGLDDWQLVDLSAEDLFGVSTQLTQSAQRPVCSSAAAPVKT